MSVLSPDGMWLRPSADDYARSRRAPPIVELVRGRPRLFAAIADKLLSNQDWRRYYRTKAHRRFWNCSAQEAIAVGLSLIGVDGPGRRYLTRSEPALSVS
jgi:hypothetical protein